jgi:hypothetical protein
MSDAWRPSAPLSSLKLRGDILARLRAYFAREGVLEVETPLLSRAGTTDPHLHTFGVRSLAPGDKSPGMFLHTSPEFAMKRLLAAALEPSRRLDERSPSNLLKVFHRGARSAVSTRQTVGNRDGEHDDPVAELFAFRRIGGRLELVQQVGDVAREPTRMRGVRSAGFPDRGHVSTPGESDP